MGVARAFSRPASARARAFLQGGLRTVSALTAPGWLAVLNRGGQLTQHGAGGHRQALARLPSLVLLASCMTASSVQTPSNAQTSSCCDSHILCHHEPCAPQKDRERYRHTLIELAKCTPETPPTATLTLWARRRSLGLALPWDRAGSAHSPWPCSLGGDHHLRQP